MTPDANALDVKRLRAAANALKTLPLGSSMLAVIEVGTEFHKQLNEDMALALLDRLEAAEKAVDECLLRDEFNKGQREKALARLDALEAEVVALRVVAEKADTLSDQIRDGVSPQWHTRIFAADEDYTHARRALDALETRKEE